MVTCLTFSDDSSIGERYPSLGVISLKNQDYKILMSKAQNIMGELKKNENIHTEFK